MAEVDLSVQNPHMEVIAYGARVTRLHAVVDEAVKRCRRQKVDPTPLVTWRDFFEEGMALTRDIPRFEAQLAGAKTDEKRAFFEAELERLGKRRIEVTKACEALQEDYEILQRVHALVTA